MARGVFISFEGSEGCGKTTQIRLLAGRLQGKGREVLTTREPGGTPIGEHVRNLLQYAPEGQGMTPECELLLFAASRAQLVREVIEPTIEKGGIVLADRFLDSTTVYQGVGRGLAIDAVNAINRFAVGASVPDVTILLDMDAETAHARARDASATEGVHDRMEGLPLEFYQKVRDGYLELADGNPERFAVIDATGSIDDIAAGIWNLLSERHHGVFG